VKSDQVVGMSWLVECLILDREVVALRTLDGAVFSSSPRICNMIAVQEVSNNLFKLVLVSLLFAVLLHPIVESMDSWDSAGPSNDTELTLVGIAIGVGLLFALSRLPRVAPVLSLCRLLCRSTLLLVPGVSDHVFRLNPPQFSSPPIPLRI
jgi:hypothetical protein